MTSVESKIQASAARRIELLQLLKDTDHAAPDLQNQTSYIADLERQLKDSAVKLGELDKKRAKELKEHEHYRDSVMKRFAYKATGRREKFEQRAAKEEREYFEVLQESHRESQLRASIEERLREAHNTKLELETLAELHKQAQTDLDGLYDSVFQGPSPGFPEEDAREQEAGAALQAYHDARVRCEGENKAVFLLDQAQNRMVSAVAGMGEAISASQWDMWGGGNMADMMERNALHRADICVREARMMVHQAARSSPHVDPDSLPPVNIAQGNIMSDVFFDNIFTDMAFHKRIEASLVEVRRCAAAVEVMATASKRRHDTLKVELKERESGLEASRVALQAARARAFEETVAKKSSTGG